MSDAKPESTSTPSDTTTTTDDSTEQTEHNFEIRPVVASDLKSGRVYIGNLAFSVAWQDLKDFFREKIGGEIGRAEVLRSSNGLSKGCGIVELETPELAAKAINTLTNTELKGRKIFVREDREEAQFGVRPAGFAGGRGRGGFGRGRGGSRGGGAPSRGRGGSRGGFSSSSSSSSSHSDNDGTRLYVGNLPWRTSWQDLKDLFSEYGSVVRADVAKDYDGRSRGFGTVQMESSDEAQKAIDALNDSEFNDRKIVVRLDAK